MNLFEKLFGKSQKKNTNESINEKPGFPSLDTFPSLDSSDRMGIILLMGDSGDTSYFPFLKYAILQDKNEHVYFAALKRIHHFKDHPETIPLLKDLDQRPNRIDYEPYLSMALSRLGILTEKEFNERMNKG